MYQILLRRRLATVFARIGSHDLEPVLAGLSPHVHHRFAGEHPLGGERNDREAVRLWFERLYRLFPDLSFEVHDVGVSGPPWDLLASVQWTALVTPAVGPSYQNVGAHVLRIRWGKVVCLHAYEDSQAVAAACALMAAEGITEASAPPIS